jgi:hypothetical protein
MAFIYLKHSAYLQQRCHLSLLADATLSVYSQRLRNNDQNKYHSVATHLPPMTPRPPALVTAAAFERFQSREFP